MNDEQYFYIDDNTRIKSTLLTWEDFLTDEGWIDWEKVDKLNAYYLIFITGVGTGKTYGCSNWYLKHGKNVGWLSNTTIGALNGVEALLDVLKENNTDNKFYDDWTSNQLNIRDQNNKIRVKGAGLRAKGSSKRARNFYANAVIYDEFNQQHDQAEIKDQNVQRSTDLITNRWSDRNHQFDHFYMFANKDGDIDILAVQMLYSLGIYSLNDYSEIFIVQRKFMDLWIDESMVFNPKIDEDKQLAIMMKWRDNPKKYKRQIQQFHSGTAQTAYFNKSENSWILDSIKWDFLEEYGEFVRSTWYLYQTPNLWLKFDVLNSLVAPKHYQYFVSSVTEIPKARKYTLIPSQLPNTYFLPDETRERLLIAFQNNKIVYDTAKTKIQFIQKNKLK